MVKHLSASLAFPVQGLSYGKKMDASHETHWLTAQEQQVWAQLSTMILRLQPVLSARLQREFGISQIDYLIMARLSEATESMLRMSVLATLCGSSLPRLSQAVGRLEKRGWLSRQSDTEDSRYTLAVLSPAGLRKLEEVAPSHVEDVREFVFDPLTQAQVRQLGTISQRIIDGLPPDESWPRTS
ncbi:MAG: MarR family transcriptional regulator [Mycobacterium sp.]|nr:MarR family transcriptional regulator [Mycobacterium sp.]